MEEAVFIYFYGKEFFMKWCYRFLLSVLVLLSVEAKSQVYTYHSFPDSNITWEGYNSCGVMGNGWESYWVVRLQGDTNRNGHVYQKIDNIGFTREDSSKRVYLFWEADTPTHERLLYDFSLSVGDTFFSKQHYYVVDSIDTLIYSGIFRRTFYLSWGTSRDVWIEGIGSDKGPTGIWIAYYGPCYWSYLCFAQQDSMIVFQGHGVLWSWGCYYFSSLENVVNRKISSIFPNPCTTTFTIQLATPPVAETYFQLYDALGRQVKREEINSTTTTIHRNNLPSGIYFWQLTERNKILERGKVVME